MNPFNIFAGEMSHYVDLNSLFQSWFLFINLELPKKSYQSKILKVLPIAGMGKILVVPAKLRNNFFSK